MSKFGGFFARRAGLYDKPADPTPSATPLTDNPLELDEELFTALGAQLGGENESLRNLLSKFPPGRPRYPTSSRMRSASWSIR